MTKKSLILVVLLGVFWGVGCGPMARFGQPYAVCLTPAAPLPGQKTPIINGSTPQRTVEVVNSSENALLEVAGVNYFGQPLTCGPVPPGGSTRVGFYPAMGVTTGSQMALTAKLFALEPDGSKGPYVGVNFRRFSLQGEFFGTSQRNKRQDVWVVDFIRDAPVYIREEVRGRRVGGRQRRY